MTEKVETERKAKNLAANPYCALMTGCNQLKGLDIVVEGQAVAVSDRCELQVVADGFELKYGPHFQSPDGTWSGLGDAIRKVDEHTAVSYVVVFRVDPTMVFGFGKGTPFSQTRWTF